MQHRDVLLRLHPPPTASRLACRRSIRIAARRVPLLGAVSQACNTGDHRTGRMARIWRTPDNARRTSSAPWAVPACGGQTG